MEESAKQPVARVKRGVQLRILLGCNPRRGLNCGSKGLWAEDQKGGTEGGGINKDGGHGAGRRSGTRVCGKKVWRNGVVMCTDTYARGQAMDLGVKGG